MPQSGCNGCWICAWYDLIWFLSVCLFACFFSANGMCIISACLGTQIFRDFYWIQTTIKAKQYSIYFRWKIEFHSKMAGWVGRIDMWLWRLWIKDCIFIAMIYQIYFLILKMILFLYRDSLTWAGTTLLFYTWSPSCNSTPLCLTVVGGYIAFFLIFYS